MFRRHIGHSQEDEGRCAPRQLTIRSERDGHAHVVRLIGELDMESTRAFDDELRRVEATDARQIIVDLSALKSIGYDGLKAFIQANARSRGGANRLKLLRGSDHVQETFETTGLVSRLPFSDHRDARSVLDNQRTGARVVVAQPIRKWAGAG
jgi:anti-anti-sigma factor